MARLFPAERPLAPSPAVSRHVQRLFKAATRGTPGATNTAQLERMLMRVLKTAGLRAVERLITGARIPGLVAVTDRVIPGRREWIADNRASHGRLDITVNSNRLFKAVSVMWLPLPPPLTPRQQQTQQVQDTFYARYAAAAERAYATPPRRISAVDRQILLIGEFEADWNNGGFSQYLLNKGVRRATAALRAIDEVGAIKTAALLRAALSSAGDDAALQRLDARLDRVREDLAVLAMTKHAPSRTQ